MTYDDIKELLVSCEVSGGRVSCLFRCPVTGKSHQACTVVSGQEPGERSAALSAVFSLLGPRVAPEERSLSEEERRAAVVRAFACVASFFERGSSGWVHRREDGRDFCFEEQLRQAPPSEPVDRAVLAAMVCEVALADERTAPEEARLLESFAPPRIPGAGMKRLTAVDLSETTPGPTRDSMLMLAWAVALADGELDPREELRLSEYARALLIPQKRVAELRGAAAGFLQSLQGFFSPQG